MPTIPFRNENDGSADRVIDQVRSAIDRGHAVTVDGRPVRSRSGRRHDVATRWMNGTVGFSVAARSGRGRVDDVWVKRNADHVAMIEISDEATS